MLIRTHNLGAYIYYYCLQDVDDQGVGTKSQEIAVYVRLLQPGQTKALPQQFRLLQNFPNPFNPETWVPYELPKASDVQITIFDSRDRLVRTLTVEVQRTGYYSGHGWSGSLGRPE